MTAQKVRRAVLQYFHRDVELVLAQLSCFGPYKKSTIFAIPKNSHHVTERLSPGCSHTSNYEGLGRLVLKFLNSPVPRTLDPFQFPYRANRSVADAVAITVYCVHLDSRHSTYARLLFIDFSSAFIHDFTQPMHSEMIDLGLPHTICILVLIFFLRGPKWYRLEPAPLECLY